MPTIYKIVRCLTASALLGLAAALCPLSTNQTSAWAAASVKNSWVYLSQESSNVEFNQVIASFPALTFSSNTLKGLSLRTGTTWGDWSAEGAITKYSFSTETRIEDAIINTNVSGSRFSLDAFRRIFSNETKHRVTGHARLGVQGQNIPLIVSSGDLPKYSSVSTFGLDLGIILSTYVADATRITIGGRWQPAITTTSASSGFIPGRALANFEFSIGGQYLLTENWSLGLLGNVNFVEIQGASNIVDAASSATTINFSQTSAVLQAGYQF